MPIAVTATEELRHSPHKARESVYKHFIEQVPDQNLRLTYKIKRLQTQNLIQTKSKKVVIGLASIGMLKCLVITHGESRLYVLESG